MTEMVGIAHVVLRVSDWRRSAHWYEDVLGFERLRGNGFTVFRHSGAPFALLFRPTDDDLPPSSSPEQHIDHIALHVASVDVLERWRDKLTEGGVPVEIDHQPGLGSSITLHDPDGLEIELFAPASGSLLEV